jgi:hypothetical protein
MTKPREKTREELTAEIVDIARRADQPELTHTKRHEQE